MLMTLNEIIRVVTAEYLSTIDRAHPPNLIQIEKGLMDATTKKIATENALRDKGERIRQPRDLYDYQVAQVMAHLFEIRRINCGDEQSIDSRNYVLGIYQMGGVNAGLYSTDKQDFWNIAEMLKLTLTTKGFEEIMAKLKSYVPAVKRTKDRDLIAVNNGIFNYRTKELLPFSPDYVFLSKSHVDFNPNAQNYVFHNPIDGTDWNVEDWMNSLSDDPEVVQSLWEIIGAIIRPNVRWSKAAFLYSEKGNNGKGSLCELMRNLVGTGAYTAIPIADFGKDFALAGLLSSQAVITDENDVGQFLDKAGNFKAVITNDMISLNIKFENPITFRFRGFMVQCINELPRTKDRSDSFYRRQLFIPMEKCFTGKERKYIKDDYLCRKEVLEYVLMKVLLCMNYYELSEPEASKELMDEYKEYNDPVRQFWNEFREKFVWNMLPYPFLYSLFQKFFVMTSPSGTMPGRNTFIHNLQAIVNAGDELWVCSDGKHAVGHLCDNPEILIADYGLTDWMNKDYRGHNLEKTCMPSFQKNYNALIRIDPSTNPYDTQLLDNNQPLPIT